MTCLNDFNDIYKKFKYQLYDFILNNYVIIMRGLRHKIILKNITIPILRHYKYRMLI